MAHLIASTLATETLPSTGTLPVVFEITAAVAARFPLACDVLADLDESELAQAA